MDAPSFSFFFPHNWVKRVHVETPTAKIKIIIPAPLHYVDCCGIYQFWMFSANECFVFALDSF